MRNAVGLAVASLAVAREAIALRFSQEPLGASPSFSEIPKKKQRQILHNYNDVQYYTDLIVGGQRITGLLDTGSFDLVVFDQGCATCGKAAKYASSKSSTFRAGTLTQALIYGSGSVDVQEGFELVSIGPFQEVNLSLWDVKSADMPVLRQAAFNCLVGVGPPETAGSDAWKEVQDDIGMVKEDLAETAVLPPNEMLLQHLNKSTVLAAELALQPTLIKANKVRQFSICLGKKHGSAGYFIWNDAAPQTMPGAFQSIRVLGRHTWTINMTSVQLASDTVHGFVGCQNGCGTIVDSGTSLLLMPYESISLLREQLKLTGANCADLRTLPNLMFKLDGKDFSLPPDAYLAKGSGVTSEYQINNGDAPTSFVAERVPLDIGGDCQLAVMGSSSITAWGPLWILGMPFFRKYYTTFQVGRNHDERTILTSLAGSNCTPTSSAGAFAHKEVEQEDLRVIDRSDILIPRIVHKALSTNMLHDL